MIVVGYTADGFGQAALDHGIAEARLRDTTVLVINSTAGDAYSDPAFAQPERARDVRARLATCGVPFELSQPVGLTRRCIAGVMDRPEAELLVIGLKHRNRGQAPAGQRLPIGAAGVPSRCLR
jgi:hypothetical protein